MSVQNCLNLGRVDVETTTDDQILGASDNEEIAILKSGEIAGVEPSLLIDRGRGFLGRNIIALHDVGPTHPQLPDFSFRHWLTIASNYSCLDSRKHGTNRIIFPWWHVEPNLGYVGRTLRYAVPMMKMQTK